jgi:hypothetical protein
MRKNHRNSRMQAKPRTGPLAVEEPEDDRREKNTTDIRPRVAGDNFLPDAFPNGTLSTSWFTWNSVRHQETSRTLVADAIHSPIQSTTSSRTGAIRTT